MDERPPAPEAEKRAQPLHSARIVGLSVSLWSIALLVGLTIARSPTPSSGFFRSWWTVLALGALFAASEIMVVHIQIGRSAHTVSVVEATMVVALFHASSIDSLIAQVIGCGLVLFFHRKQRSIKLFFNLAMFAVENQLAFAVFRAFRGGTDEHGTPGLQSWPAAYGATATFTVTGILLVFMVIFLAENEFSIRDRVGTLRISMITSVVMASVGIAAATLLAVSPFSALLLGLPIAGAYANNRTLLRERRRIEELEFLRESSTTLMSTDAAEHALWAVLEAARAEFGVELVEYEHRDGGESLWRRVSFRRDCAPAVTPLRGSALVAVCPVSPTIVRVGTETPDALEIEIASRGVGSTAIVLPVLVSGSVEGVLIFAQPSTNVIDFGPNDLRLADMLASQLSSALENRRLEQSVADLRDLENKLVHELEHDALTGLLSREAFEGRIRDALNPPLARHVAVMFVDLDDFKLINDSRGHAAGDAVLRAIGKRLRATIRPTDSGSRIAGDEFAILVSPIMGEAEAAEIATRFLSSFGEPISLNDGEFLTVGASIGVALAHPSDTIDSLLERADAAMLRAKARGKGQVEVSGRDAGTSARTTERQLDLTDALTHHQLTTVYQSVHRLEDGQVTSYECLLRWQHPSQGLLYPDQFMPTGPLSSTQRAVRRFVCGEVGLAMAGLSKTEYRGPISINLSAGQVQDESLLDDLVRLCLTTSLTMDRIFIEIAEPAFQRSTDAMLRRTDQLRATGVGVVLDDLGLDKLTLGFLERLRPTQVKLSRTLVQQLIHRPSAAPFVRAVTELGRSMGYEVVAKGTEDMRIASEALALGCTFGQGYFFSRPMPLAAILPVAGDIAMAAHR